MRRIFLFYENSNIYLKSLVAVFFLLGFPRVNLKSVVQNLLHTVFLWENTPHPFVSRKACCWLAGWSSSVGRKMTSVWSSRFFSSFHSRHYFTVMFLATRRGESARRNPRSHQCFCRLIVPENVVVKIELLYWQLLYRLFFKVLGRWKVGFK